jgi:hypothetical protein
MGTLVLDATTKTIQAVMSGAAATSNPEYTVAYADSTSSSLTEGASDGALNGTSGVTIASAPAASTRRVIKWITIQNKDTASVTVTITYNNSSGSTSRQIAKVTLASNDTWTTDGTFDSTGSLKQTAGSVPVGSITGLGTGVATWLATPSSANLATAVTDETGTGALVFANTPTLVTPVLGTPTSGTLSNCTVDGTNGVGYINAPQNSQSGSTYTLVLGDAGKSVYITSGSTATLTVPTNSSVAFATGTTILVLNNNSGNLTISGAGVTFQLANGATGNRTVATKGMATLIKVATDTWWVSGAGVT